MIFKDPMQTIQTEIPAGWVYDPFNSTLTDFVFSRWDQPQEMLAIHVRRASIPADRPDEEWIQTIRSETRDNPTLKDLSSTRGPAVAAEFASSRGWVQRVAFVRGPRVELVVEQRSSLQTAQNMWEPLERAVRTAVSDANLELPEEVEPEEFNRSVQAVNQAFEKDDPDEIEIAIRTSIAAGISTWLHSMVMPDRALEVNAAVRVAQATMHLGLFSGAPSLVRSAEFMLRRAQHSLEAAGLDTDWVKELGQQISEALRSIWSELMQLPEPEGDGMLPILSLRERGFREAAAAARAFELGDLESALDIAGTAVDDLLSLIAFLRQNRPQEIPEDIVAHLNEQGITDRDKQIDAIRKAREALLLPPLNMAVQIRHCCALERGDVDASAETVAVREPLARLVVDFNPEDAGAALNLVLALMDRAGAASLGIDGLRLDEASGCLDEAAERLSTVKLDGTGNDFWIHYHKNQTDAALTAFDRCLADAGLKNAASLVDHLSALRSRFQAIAAEFRESASRYAPPGNQTGGSVQ